MTALGLFRKTRNVITSLLIIWAAYAIAVWNVGWVANVMTFYVWALMLLGLIGVFTTTVDMKKHWKTPSKISPMTLKLVSRLAGPDNGQIWKWLDGCLDGAAILLLASAGWFWSAALFLFATVTQYNLRLEGERWSLDYSARLKQELANVEKELAAVIAEGEELVKLETQKKKKK